MTVPNRQIGEGPEVQLLRQISKQLEQLTKVVASLTVTTTTTAAP